MSKKYMLIARAEVNGAVQEPGYIFTLEDGTKGPHKTVGVNGPGAHDVPLYEEWKEPEPKKADTEYPPDEPKPIPLWDITDPVPVESVGQPKPAKPDEPGAV